MNDIRSSRLLVLLLSLATVEPAVARSLTSAEQQALRSGEIIGATSVCRDIAGDRLVALGQKIIAEIRSQVFYDEDVRRVQSIHETAVYAMAAKVSRGPRSMCLKAIESFERLERACLTSERIGCTLRIPPLRL